MDQWMDPVSMDQKSGAYKHPLHCSSGSVSCFLGAVIWRLVYDSVMGLRDEWRTAAAWRACCSSSARRRSASLRSFCSACSWSASVWICFFASLSAWLPHKKRWGSTTANVKYKFKYILRKTVFKLTKHTTYRQPKIAWTSRFYQLLTASNGYS